MHALLLMLMTLLPGQALGEKPTSADNSDDEKLKAAVAKMAKETSSRCEFSIAASKSSGGKSAKLVQHPEPILRWSNPTAGSVFGEVYVWTDNGRPAVVASLYRWFSPDWGDTIEVCSLSDARVAGRRNQAEFWSPAEPGIQFQTIADADEPATAPAARLVQMRRLASGFVAELADTRGNDAGTKRQLRLLNQPVFRYPAPKGDTSYLDGALFAFVEGTDPEVLLLIEAVTMDGKPTWQFGFARMNRDALRVTFRDKSVWSVPFIENPLSHSREPYTLFPIKSGESP